MKKYIKASTDIRSYGDIEIKSDFLDWTDEDLLDIITRAAQEAVSSASVTLTASGTETLPICVTCPANEVNRVQAAIDMCDVVHGVHWHD